MHCSTFKQMKRQRARERGGEAALSTSRDFPASASAAVSSGLLWPAAALRLATAASFSRHSPIQVQRGATSAVRERRSEGQ